MRLKQLQYFVAVAEELHFSRAAARLHISQPPLSQQIQRLEKDLNVPLFYRSNRSVRLTEAGEVLYREIQPMLLKLENIRALVSRANSGQCGQLSIAFAFSATFTILPLIVREFIERFPDIELDLQEMHVEHQLHALMSENIDVGILRLPVRHSVIVTQTLHREVLVVALPEGHRLGSKRQLSLKDLASVPFIMGKDSGGFFDSIRSLCRKAGFEPLVRKEVSDLQAALGLVSVGLGITLVPETVKESPTKHVVFRFLQESPLTELAIAWKRGNESLVLQNFLGLARELKPKIRRTLASTSLKSER